MVQYMRNPAITQINIQVLWDQQLKALLAPSYTISRTNIQQRFGKFPLSYFVNKSLQNRLLKM
jgi:hypothetical protein